jgi:hypothetical protein
MFPFRRHGRRIWGKGVTEIPIAVLVINRKILYNEAILNIYQVNYKLRKMDPREQKRVFSVSLCAFALCVFSR